MVGYHHGFNLFSSKHHLYEYELNCQEKSKFCKVISLTKWRIISLMHSSILPWIWLSLMAPCLVFIGSFIVFTFFFQISNFFDLSITEETWLIEMRIWCIKIGIVLVFHYTTEQNSTVIRVGHQYSLSIPYQGLVSKLTVKYRFVLYRLSVFIDQSILNNCLCICKLDNMVYWVMLIYEIQR
jgi:hypothetical protein